MKHSLSILILAFSTFAYADRIEIPCTFKENGKTQDFKLAGNRNQYGSFNTSGRVSNISVNFTFSPSAGRTMNVSYGGTTNTLSLSGSGKMSYPAGGLAGMALGAMGMKDDRKIKIKCMPEDLVVVAAPVPASARVNDSGREIVKEVPSVVNEQPSVSGAIQQ